jgi:hypothetical protein
MIDYDRIYESSIIKGSFFNQMIDCGSEYNIWVENALKYLPLEILNKHKESLAFISTNEMDGCRVARFICENREIIVLSERIFPKKGVGEAEAEVRYLTFVVLHEVVHAVKKHRSPLFDDLSPEVKEAQEKEADELALTWFNEHIRQKNNPNFKPITMEEVKEAQAKQIKIHALMESLK